MAAGATYEPIATTTLGSAAASITFSSIPGTYTDLRVVYILRTDRANTVDGGKLQFNSDTATNYSNTYISGDGTSALSNRASTVNSIDIVQSIGNNATSGIFGLTTVDIFSYAGSTFKTCLITTSTDQNGSGRTNAIVGLWRSTSAITTITLTPSTGPNWLAGCTATLYGIKAA